MNTNVLAGIMSVFPKDHPLASEFVSLAMAIKECHRCEGLNIEGETEAAPGSGNPNAKIMVVGQSLCARCMKTQVPFSGGSGRLLDSALERSNLRKADIFVTNVVHCHTRGNRKSFPHEIANCLEYLMKEIELVGPKAIIALGKDAVSHFLGPESWPGEVGKRVVQPSYVVYPSYHPSYVMKLGKYEVTRYIQTLSEILRFES